MIKRISAMLAAVFAVSAGSTAHAFAYRQGAEYDDNAPTGYLLAERLGVGSPVVTGKWHADLDAALAYAEANGIPLVAIWSNGDQCGHCKKWENNALSDAFEKWMANSGVVFYFGYYGDSGKGATLGEWCYWCGRGNPGGVTLPLVRLYWKVNGTVKVDMSANGDTVDGNKGRCTISSSTYRADEPYYVPGDQYTYNPGGRYMIDYLKNVFAGYDGSGANTYYGGEFTAVDDPNAGLQVVAGVTPRLNIPLWRTNSTSVAKSSVNIVWGEYPDGSSFTNTVTWSEGQKSYLLPIDITKNNRVSASDAGKTIRLVLFTEKKKKVTESHVYIVSEDSYANSPANPLWIGERTADTLEFGEWTMDIDAVTNKVRAWNASLGLLSSSSARPKLGATSGRRAYSLIYIGGSRWCPDCVMADKYFFDDARFKAWAQKCNIALGVIDIPNNPNQPSGSPSLLTYYTFTASDNFVTARGTQAADETQRLQSGVPYISRKGIVMSGNNGVNASAVAARNRQLVAQNTLNGGWNRPERTNQNRTGVPCLIALRDDGSIAGRWSFFSDLGPSGWSDGYLRRIEEVLSQSDVYEESNQDWRTTEQVVAKRGVSSLCSMSHSDLIDAYRIDEGAVGQTVSFRISCTNDVKGTLRVVQASDLLEKTLAETSGNFADGIEVTSAIPDTNCYFVVAIDVVSSSKPATPVSDFVSATKPTSTIFMYSIESDSVVSPKEVEQHETVVDSNKLTISIVSNTTYKITNLDAGAVSEYLEPGVGDDIYIAKWTGSVALTLKDKDSGEESYSCSYQVWNTGKIGFEVSAASVAESDDPYAYEVKVVRTGGSSGLAKATLKFIRDDPRCSWISRLDELGQVDAIFAFNEFEWDDKDVVDFTWASGESDVKHVTVYVNPNNNADGELKLVFGLEQPSGTSDAALDISSFVLTIRDNDEANPGTLSIVETVPAWQKSLELVAKGGETVDISVSRTGGSDGFVTGVVSASAGVFEDSGDSITEIDWLVRDSTVQTVSLTLPHCTNGEDTVWVRLGAEYGAKVDPFAAMLAIRIVGEDVLSFEQSSVDKAIVRYVPIEEVCIAVTAPGEIDWTNVSIRKYAGSLPPGLSWRFDEISHSLVISGVATRSGAYVASFRVYAGDDAGMAVSLAFDVSDPLSEALSSERTFVDMPVTVQDGDSSSLAGVMTMTVSPSGRASAKYRSTDGRTLVYSSENWNSSGEAASYSATLNGVTDNQSSMNVQVATNGEISISFSDPACTNGVYLVSPKSSEGFSVTNWYGYYTVNLKQTGTLSGDAPLATGDGYILLNMTNRASVLSGRMTYAGILPNGKSFSGAGLLQPGVYDEGIGEYATAVLPIVSGGDSDSLYGVLSIKPYAKDEHTVKRRSVASDAGTAFSWCHVDRIDDVSYEVSLEPYGGFYDVGESLAVCCESTFETLDLMFFALPNRLLRNEEFASGAPLAWVTNSDIQVGVRFDSASKSSRLGLLRPAKAYDFAGLTMNVNLAAGVINGTFELGFEGRTVTALYRGVILPGWGTGCGECTLGNADAIERPFIGGSFWYTEGYEYTDVKGRPRTLSVKRGAPISVGVNPGE